MVLSQICVSMAHAYNTHAFYHVIEMVTNSPPAKSSISGECILCILACVTMALAVGPSPASSTPIRPPRVWSLSAHGESFDDAPQLPFLIQTSFLKMKRKKLITD